MLTETNPGRYRIDRSGASSSAATRSCWRSGATVNTLIRVSGLIPSRMTVIGLSPFVDTRSPGHRHLVDAVHDRAVLVGQLVHRLGEPQAGHALEQRAEDDLQLQPGEVGADTVVQAEAEGDLAAGVTMDVQLGGVVERLFVPVGRECDRDDALALADQFAADLDVGHRDPRGGQVGDREVAQELLGHVRGQVGVALELGELVGVLQQGHRAQRDHVRAGLMPGDEQQPGHAGELVVVVPPGLLIPHHQTAEQVLSRVLPLVGDELAEVVLELHEAGHPVLGGAGPAHHHLGVLVEEVVVLQGHAEQCADHRGRHRQGELLDEVDRRLLGEHRGEALVDDLLDARAHLPHPPVGELGGDHLPVRRVLRRVHAEERRVRLELLRHRDEVRVTGMAPIRAEPPVVEYLPYLLIAGDQPGRAAGGELDADRPVFGAVLLVLLRRAVRVGLVLWERSEFGLRRAHAVPSRSPSDSSGLTESSSAASCAGGAWMDARSSIGNPAVRAASVLVWTTGIRRPRPRRSGRSTSTFPKQTSRTCANAWPGRAGPTSFPEWAGTTACRGRTCGTSPTTGATPSTGVTTRPRSTSSLSSRRRSTARTCISCTSARPSLTRSRSSSPTAGRVPSWSYWTSSGRSPTRAGTAALPPTRSTWWPPPSPATASPGPPGRPAGTPSGAPGHGRS